MKIMFQTLRFRYKVFHELYSQITICFFHKLSIAILTLISIINNIEDFLLHCIQKETGKGDSKCGLRKLTTTKSKL